jgi:hypothetical protein
MVNGEPWLGGQHSIEIYQNTGNASFPFERITGVYHEVGVASAMCMVSEDNSLFFLDDTRMFRRSTGYSTKIISSRAVAKEVQGYNEVSNCQGYSFIDKGDTFIVWTFPAELKTWVYNARTEQWHKWASYPNDGRHISNCYSYFNGKHIVGKFDDDILYEMSSDYYDDAGKEIRSVLVLPELWDEGRDIDITNLVLDAHTGTGLVVDATLPASGQDPQIMMDYSINRQRTWDNEQSQDLGKMGAYDNPVIWDGLGSSNRMQFRITCTEPCEFVISSAHYNVDL